MNTTAIDRHESVLKLARAAMVVADVKGAIDCLDMALDQISIFRASIEDAWIQSQEANRQRDEFAAAYEKALRK